MAGFVLDLGLETFEVQDSEGNVRGTICFNPSDPGLAGRWDAVQKRLAELAERPEGLQGMEDIAQLDAELKAGIDQAFGSPVSGVLFGPVSSLAICADGFLAVCYLLGIDLGCFIYADQPATCFHILAVVLPMLFTRPALWNILRTALYEGVFACCVVTFKTPEVAAMDLMDAGLFGVMACVISTYYVRALTDNVVARCKLKVIAETDLNTQIPNRNAYENHMHEYPLRCANSLSCVYVDVNGLHELNNTKGHDAGDVMLKIVAQEMTKIFGRKDTYRIGGDEFVAFVVDTDLRHVREMMQTLEQAVEAHGYSVAVGCATCSAGGIQIKALIKQAETRMYDAKDEHYQNPGIQH